MLTRTRHTLIRLLLVLSLFAAFSAATMSTTPVEAGMCVTTGAGNCG